MNGRRWEATLELEFAHRAPRTVLVRNRHVGPLQVQKALYPEGPGVCHVAVLHPPGGIVSGDSLTCDARLGHKSMACLTTPGAAKWYRCPGAWSGQALRFQVAEAATLEWLPRETILFDASRVRLRLDVDLAAGARFYGWEILCFGRRASGECWRSGALELRSSIRREGRPLWSERASVGGGRFADSPAGLAGFSVSATFVVAGPDSDSDAALLAACRGLEARRGVERSGARTGITSLPGVMLARYLGNSSEDAFSWFTSLWRLLRPAQLNIAATPPRLWAC
jgi:urease accessory protein